MPRFEITGPDGAKYQVDGPEGATEQDALAQIQKQVGQAPSPTTGHNLTGQESQDMTAGKGRALRDLIDRPASWLAHGSDYLGITSGEGARVDAGNTADRLAYEQQQGESGAATAGRMAGQIGLTLPIGGTLGKIATGVGDVIGAGASQVAPWIGAGINRANAFLSGTAGGAGGVVPRAEQVGSIAASGALQGATAGALTSGQSDAPIGQQVLQGAEAGAVVAPAAKLASEIPRAVSGAVFAPASKATQDLVNIARDKWGISVTGDMISPSPAVRNIGSVLRQVPLSGQATSHAEVMKQAQRAIGTTIGEDVTEITPAVMERAVGRVGKVMDDAAAATPVIPAPGLVDGMAKVQHEASYLTPDQQGMINKHVDDVMAAIGDNQAITGQQYQSLTKFDSALGKASRSTDSDVRQAAIDIRHHLDDALEASLPPGSPVIPQLKEARLQYKNIKTIEPLVTKGEPGEISAQGLQAQVNRSFKGRGLKEQQPDLGEIADIMRQFKLTPDSGTAIRNTVFGGLATAGGAGASLMSGDPMSAAYTAGTAALGMGAGAAAGSFLRSPAYINKLLQSPEVATYPGASLLQQYAAPANALLSRPLRK